MNDTYLFMKPLLGKLGEGAFFCRLIAHALRATAALIVLFSLVTFFEAGKLIFQLPAQGILGRVLFELFFVLAIYAVVHVFLIRARDIEQIQAGEFYALPSGARCSCGWLARPTRPLSPWWRSAAASSCGSPTSSSPRS